MNRLLNALLLALAVIAAWIFFRELFVSVPAVRVARIRAGATQWDVPTCAAIGGLAGTVISMIASVILLASVSRELAWRALQIGGLLLAALCFVIWIRDLFSSAGKFG